MNNLTTLFEEFFKWKVFYDRCELDNAEILILFPNMVFPETLGKNTHLGTTPQVFICNYFSVWYKNFPNWRIELYRILDSIFDFFPKELVQEITSYHSSAVIDKNSVPRAETFYNRSCKRIELRTRPANWILEFTLWTHFLYSSLDWMQVQLNRSFIPIQNANDLPSPYRCTTPNYQKIIQIIKYEKGFLKTMEYILSDFEEEDQLFLFQFDNLVSTRIISYYRNPTVKVIVRIMYRK